MGSTPYWGPDEPAYEIFLERAFLASEFLSGMGYGIQLILYIFCALYLWNTRKLRGKKPTYLLIYITVLLCVETILVTVQARIVQVVYIDERNYPGGPWLYFLANRFIINIYCAALFVLTFLSDLLVLWRCWAIWGGSETFISYAVVALPFLMVLASFAIGILWIFSQPSLSLHSALTREFGASYFLISLSVNILLTTLITARLLFYRRRVMSTLPPGHGAQYFSLAALFVESAALYSIASIAFIVSYASSQPICLLFLCTTSSAQQISGYLIIYRLAVGRAWNQGASTNNVELPTLHFDNSTCGYTAPTSSTNLEPSIEGTPFVLPCSRPDGLIYITAKEKKDEEEISGYISPR